MEDKTCCIFNIAVHYRAPIYTLMDRKLNCDFYLGDHVNTKLKKMDYASLKGFRKELPNIYFSQNVYWQKGVVPLLFKKQYSAYILTGDLHSLSNWVFMVLGFFSRKKIGLWTHGWYGKEGRIKKFFKKIYFGLADMTFLYGDYARNGMIANGFDGRKLYCVYNSLDYDRQKEIRKGLSYSSLYKEHFGNEFPVIIYVGRIQENKRLDILFTALAELKQKGRNYNVMLVGEDVEKTGLAGSIDADMRKNVWFYGPCYDEKILADLIYNADLCVSPGNVGLTAIHTFTYGCPVITQDNYCNQRPEFEVITPGVTGDFFRENDAHDLADKILKWTETMQGNRETIRQQCFRQIESKYNPHYQIEVIQKALSGQPEVS
ncbi:MAG: glycosyltransferase [Bacteroides sp.]|nr:glycosyltransferase [Bacteroides sp.]